jgi:hypothetical protein
MPRLQMQSGMRLGAVLVVAGTLGACASEKPVPVSDLRPWKPISWRCEEASGATRKQIIQHNSVYASLKANKKVAYQDDCPKPKAPATS